MFPHTTYISVVYISYSNNLLIIFLHNFYSKYRFFNLGKNQKVLFFKAFSI